MKGKRDDTYSLDNLKDILSASLLDKLRKMGVTDITELTEEQILALGLNEVELNELIDAIYLAKYLKASPALMAMLKNQNINPLTLWKMNYNEVNALEISEPLKKELFGHVMSQQNSFVANVEIPTSRKIIMKGWKDENLAFLARHDAKLVTKDNEAKEELNAYIVKLRAGTRYSVCFLKCQHCQSSLFTLLTLSANR